MKVRTGFVSNSSSSSFTLIVPKGMSLEEIKTELVQRLGISDGCFLKDLKEGILKAFIENLSKEDLKESLEEAIRYKFSEENINMLQNAINNDMDFYIGHFNSDGDASEIMLCYSVFDIQEDKFYLIKEEAGY